MDKKIGILTFHYAINYGAVLQAFALSQTCEKLGYEVEIINYCTQSHERANRIINDSKRGLFKTLIYSLLVMPHLGQLKRKKNRFRLFLKEKLHISYRFFSSKELMGNLPPKDAYITGSDQVFNPVSFENIRAYYLDFEKQNGSKKIAYAPSFGISSFDEALTDKIGHLLKDFDSLSCREDDGANYIESVTGRVTPTVLDPVLLLNEEEWKALSLSIKKPCKTKGKYIFVYDLNGRDNLIALAQKLQHKVRLPIVCLTTKKYCVGRYNVDEVIMDAGPKEFVSLVSNAAYVLTDSFHGTAFSLIFKKQFLAYNALPKASQRIRSLLSALGLNERLVENVSVNEEEVFKCINQADDYQSILNELIDKSKSYLINSLS